MAGLVSSTDNPAVISALPGTKSAAPFVVLVTKRRTHNEGGLHPFQNAVPGEKIITYRVYSDMEFPFSVFIYEAPLRPGGKAHWNEVLRANNQQWAIYAAGLLHNAGVPHQDTVRERPVVKAVRYGITFLSLPSDHAVELCEKVIARQETTPGSRHHVEIDDMP